MVLSYLSVPPQVCQQGEREAFEQVPVGMEDVVAETEEVHLEIWKASRAINLISPECIDTDKSYLQ